MTSDAYAIRRAIVRAMARYFCPQDLNTCLCDDDVILLSADSARIRREWDELTAAGYLRPVQGYPEFRSVAPQLRRKLEAGETLLDEEFFAGPAALR